MDFKPFKPRPVFGFLYVSLFISCVWLVSPTPCFLFSSLSLRRWGNPNPLRGVWGSPCGLFFLYTLPDLDPYFVLDTYTTATPSTCFFFSVVVVRFPSWVFLGFVLGLVGFLAVFLVLLWVLACKMTLMHLGGAGKQDISRPLG